MRMKTFSGLLMVVMVLAMLMTACGGGGGEEASSANDVKSLFKEMIGSAETFVSKVENAQSVGDIVNAINELADKMESVLPRVKEMVKNKPELNAANDPELQELQTKLMTTFTSLAPKMQEKMAALQATATPDDIQNLMKAAQRMQNIGTQFTELSK